MRFLQPLFLMRFVFIGEHGEIQKCKHWWRKDTNDIGNVILPRHISSISNIIRPRPSFLRSQWMVLKKVKMVIIHLLDLMNMCDGALHHSWNSIEGGVQCIWVNLYLNLWKYLVSGHGNPLFWSLAKLLILPLLKYLKKIWIDRRRFSWNFTSQPLDLMNDLSFCYSINKIHKLVASQNKDSRHSSWILEKMGSMCVFFRFCCTFLFLSWFSSGCWWRTNPSTHPLRYRRLQLLLRAAFISCSVCTAALAAADLGSWTALVVTLSSAVTFGGVEGWVFVVLNAGGWEEFFFVWKVKSSQILQLFLLIYVVWWHSFEGFSFWSEWWFCWVSVCFSIW